VDRLQKVLFGRAFFGRTADPVFLNLLPDVMKNRELANERRGKLVECPAPDFLEDIERRVIIEKRDTVRQNIW